MVGNDTAPEEKFDPAFNAILTTKRNVPVEQRLQMLQHLATFSDIRVPGRITLKGLRDRFERDREKYPLATRCWVCDVKREYSRFTFVRHHIIPLSGGGPNRLLNIVTLCHSCHAAVHPWLEDSVHDNRWRKPVA